MKISAIGSLAWFTAQIKLAEIYEARNQIAKAQTAYGVYQAFGNRTQMEAVHQVAEAARQKLESLGVNKLQYEPGKDLSGYFKQAAVQVCEYDPSITAGSVPLLQDEAYQLLLRMAMEPGIQGEWAKSQLPAKRLEVQLAQTAKILAAKIEAEQRLAGPPVNLPDGTPITAKNKENEITLAYFQDKVYNADAQLTPMYTAYLGWLEDTYGMTEWRKKVVQADAVVMSFTEALIKEIVMGVVDTAKFAFNLAVDPEKTTQEVLDQANYLINHPEVLVEAAKTVYHNFEEGTPEERAAMLGSVASVLVPGLSVTKSGKVGQVLDEVQGLADKAVEGVKDLGKALKNSEKFPDRNPFVTTPEGFTINFNAGKIPETNPLPKTSVQEHYLSEMDGLGDGKAGKIEGVGEGNKPNLYDKAGNYTGRRTQKELDDLARDPASNGKIEPKNIREREVGLAVEERGRLGKLVRDPQAENGAEFIDTSSGLKWDVKSFESYPSGDNGVPITNPKKGAFTIKQGMKKLQKEFDNGNNIIIDTRKMEPEHVEQLKKAIDEEGVTDKIIWYP
ncbi:hypothetical protein [Paenibacillus sp. FSL R7-0273]|uniref:hypothetical protein n=1 Tax=Paenibacillus sp. FSL R7-0273 TaxID=1536772 RepID=UPI0012E079C9|nr:hypothetical protein [Paenibacillus sp. FSL R7-0273]